jgi:enoyl-CoA hydratase/carnithine racemase
MDDIDARAEFDPGTDELLYERRGPIAVLTFNRPAARNSMTVAMYHGLADVSEHVDADERVGVLVLRGAGDQAFVAGTDIARFKSFSTEEHVLTYEHDLVRCLSRLEAVQKPTIAMIRGYCVGGGALIASACDLRIASEDAKFGIPIARTLGNIISGWGFAHLLALIGPSRTKELLFTTRFMNASEGTAIGLFNEVVEAERLEVRTFELATTIAGHAPLTLHAVKEGVRRILEQGPGADLDDLVLQCYMSADFKEGVAAFFEKRLPHWTGR